MNELTLDFFSKSEKIGINKAKFCKRIKLIRSSDVVKVCKSECEHKLYIYVSS